MPFLFKCLLVQRAGNEAEGTAAAEAEAEAEAGAAAADAFEEAGGADALFGSSDDESIDERAEGAAAGATVGEDSHMQVCVCSNAHPALINLATACRTYIRQPGIFTAALAALTKTADHLNLLLSWCTGSGSYRRRI